MTVVVGGGIVGLSSALALARAGHRVVLYAPRDDDAPSWGNAGHIAVEQVAPLASRASLFAAPANLFARGGALDLPLGMARHWLPFSWSFLKATAPARFTAGREALSGLLADAMPAWQRLASNLGAPDLVRDNGHLIVWESASSAVSGALAWQSAAKGTATLGAAPIEMEAKLADLTDEYLHGPLAFTGSGQICDLDRLHDLLVRALGEAGVEVRDARASIDLSGGRAMIDGVAPDMVLVAAGSGSRALMERTGHRVPMIAERGYHIRARAENWPDDLPPVVFEDRSMIVTRYANCVQAASFVELGDPTAPPDPRKWQRLEAHVAELGLPMGPPYRRWRGSRPTLPDYLPAIGKSRRVSNLHYAFGHQHLGLTLGPLTGEIVAAMVGDARLPCNLAPFDIERFQPKRRQA